MLQKKLPGWRRNPDRIPRSRPGVTVTVRPAASGEPVFDMIFYNIELSRLTSVAFVEKETPEAIAEANKYGGALIRKTLQARGLNPDEYVCTLFDVRHELCELRKDTLDAIP